MTDPAPTPRKWDGTTITDADDKLVCIIAQRLCQQEVLIAEIMAAPEMHWLLIEVENYLSATVPDYPLTVQVRAMLTLLGGDE